MKLTAEERAVWLEHAPKAIESGTLVPSKTPGFRLLCELVVKMRRAAERADKGGASEDRVYQGYVKLVDGAFKEFMLTAFGKPVAARAPVKAANPSDRYLNALTQRKA